MRIVNVIERSQSGSMTVHSFPVREELLSQDVVDEAESLFVKILTENHVKNIDMEESLEAGYYDDNRGYELYLIWSE